tara:strand:+ start:2440 stop:2625 length:186 start_codon:yes stop_codon:yes gene_type:complete
MSSATLNRAIRLPTPPRQYNTQWANSLVSIIETQIRVANLAENAANKITQEKAEAVVWFNG